MKAYDKIPEWKEIIFKELTPEDEEYIKHNWMYIIENLPEYNEDVIVTDGIDVRNRCIRRSYKWGSLFVRHRWECG